MSDSDDHTFRYKKEKTEVSGRRVSVRMLSGKVYGPYRRTEILGFISTRKVRGEEEILYEGETDWQPIASDPEFFDALHALLEGKLPSTRSDKDRKEKSRSEGKGTAVQEPLSDVEGIVKTEVSGTKQLSSGPSEDEEETRATALTETEPVLPKKSKKKSRTQSPPPASGSGWTPNHAVSPLGSALPKPATSLKKRIKKSQSLFLPTVIVIALAVAYVWSGGSKISTGGGTSKSTSLRYFGALNEALKTWKNREIPSMPAALELEGPAVRVGGNAESWTHSLQAALATNGSMEVRNTKAYWIQLAWDLASLGSVVQVQSGSEGKKLREQSEAIRSELSRKGLLTEEDKTLFAALEQFRVSDLENALRLSEKLPDDAARWIFENCSWLLYWEKHQKKPHFGSSRAFAEPTIDHESRVRRAFAMRDARIGDAMEALADQNPFSETLWFASGEVLWRGQKGVGVTAAGQSFVAGLHVLSLAPPALQVNFWREYADFLKSYGRKTSLDSALANLEMIPGGNLGLPSVAKKWWDLGNEGVDPTVYSEGLLRRSREAELGPGELAALKVFGRLLPDGNAMLAVVATDLLFRGKFDVAEKVIDQMVERNSSDPEAIGLKIWLDSEEFRFFDALQGLDKGLSGAPTLMQKYRMPLLVIAREYGEAEDLINLVTKARPQDPWPHYWRAQIKKARGEPKACMASANLARLQGRGSQSRAAEILQYECQILAKINLEKAIKELDGLMSRHSTETRYLPLIADAYLALDEPGNALKYLERAIETYAANADLLLALGKVYERSREPEKAKAVYQSIAQRVPGDGRGLMELGRLLEGFGKAKEAARTYQAAAVVNPRMPEVFLKAARAMEKAGLIQEAAKMYGREIEVRPAVLATFVEAATFLLKNNNPKLVPDLYRKFAGGGFEQDPTALLRLAQAYFAMEDFENARISAANALSVDPKNPEIYLILAQSLEKLGEYPTARSYYQRYLGLNPGATDADEIQNKISRPPFSAD